MCASSPVPPVGCEIGQWPACLLAHLLPIWAHAPNVRGRAVAVHECDASAIRRPDRVEGVAPALAPQPPQAAAVRAHRVELDLPLTLERGVEYDPLPIRRP